MLACRGARWVTAGRQSWLTALAREVLPWADPYVAQLIKNLQNEVREERRLESRVKHYRASGSEQTAA